MLICGELFSPSLPLEERVYEPSDLRVTVNVFSSSMDIPIAIDDPVRNELLLVLLVSDMGVQASLGLSDFIDAKKSDKLQHSTNLQKRQRFY